MSASNKKKLRKELYTDILSEKQRQEQAEAKKLKTYTIGFVATMVLVVCVALGVLGVRAVNNSGVIQKNTVAATIGDREISSVELSYYFIDTINKFYSEMSSTYSDSTDTYLQAMGLDASKALDRQTYDEETGETWADYFMNSALEQAKNDYALYDIAKKEDYKLTTEEQENIDSYLGNIEVYAKLYGYKNSDQFLRGSYGYGASLDSYSEYYERSEFAKSYYNAYPDTLTYDETAIREYDKANTSIFNSYTYTSCYMSYTAFRQGGTKDDKGNVTYSDEENNAARDKMKEVAEDLATATSADELKTKAEAIKVNEDNELKVSKNENMLHTSINAALSEWLADENRKEGDIAAIPNTSTTKNEDGTETTVTNGYYVVIFHSISDNFTKMGNVRHLLVSFEGGTEDEESGETVYSDKEKTDAKATADKYLAEWLAGDATEDTFITLVQKNSDDSSAEEGGLYKNVAPNGKYVAEFQNWVLDESRKAGDTDVIETEYGYHVMYYVGDSEMNYRDYMITEKLRSADFEAWYKEATENITASLGDTSKIRTDLILSN